MHVFHEMHCDDLLLERRRDRATWRATADLVEAVLEVAEAREVRMALRLRHPLVEGALAFGGVERILAWVERGHELGLHAHGAGIRRTARALADAGLGDFEVVVPGAAGRSRRVAAALLAACEGLGAWVCTDQLLLGTYPYAGLVPWRPARDLRRPGEGPWVLVEPAADPWRWGLLERTPWGVRQVHGLRRSHFERLLAQLETWRSLPAPGPVTTFGYTFHDHQHARGPEDLRPDPASLAAWDAFLAAVARTGQTSSTPLRIARRWLSATGSRPGASRSPARRAAARAARALDGPLARLDRSPGPVRAARDHLAPLLRRLPTPRAPSGAGGGAGGGPAPARRLPDRAEHRLPVGGREVRALRIGPARPRAAVVVSVAGDEGGCTALLAPFGLDPEALARRGVVTWCFDRAGTGATRGAFPLTPGTPAHAEDAGAVFRLARAEGVPTGWLTWSGGLVAALQAAARQAPAFVLDVEGPADRLSLRPARTRSPLRRRRGREMWAHGLEDDGWWRPREPFRLLASLGPVPYHRVQGLPDHQHGPCLDHARVLLHAARGPAGVNGRPGRDLPDPAGPLEPGLVLDGLEHLLGGLLTGS